MQSSDPIPRPAPFSARVQRLFDVVLGAVVVALVLGFFGVLWTKSASIDSTLTALNAETAQTLASVQVLIKEVATVQESAQGRLETLEKTIEAQRRELQALRDYLAKVRPNGPQPPQVTTPSPVTPLPAPEVQRRTQETEQRIQDAIQRSIPVYRR